ncbi:MAG: hypothetical protein MJ058_08130 [Akkermansia sp.]|nr:hypothetical protein [Akkermansia sp.]
MSAKEYRKSLARAMLELLWRQWGRLGVLGSVGGNGTRMVLDPEALLVFTAWFGRNDQRLYDAAASWLVRYSRLVSLPRLKAVCRRARVKDTRSLGYLASLVAEHGDGSWGRLASAWTPEPDAARGMNAEPMFPASARMPEADARAAEFGFLRNTFLLEEKKVAPELPRGAATLLMSLRGHVGCTARAEMLLLLLLSPCCRLQELVDRSGYARASVFEAVNELLLGQVVERHALAARGGEYSLRNAARWRALLDAPPRCAFPRWHCLYDALGLVWNGISNPRLDSLSEQTFHGELRRVMDSGARRMFLHAGIPGLVHVDADNVQDLPGLLLKLD